MPCFIEWFSAPSVRAGHRPLPVPQVEQCVRSADPGGEGRPSPTQQLRGETVFSQIHQLCQSMVSSTAFGVVYMVLKCKCKFINSFLFSQPYKGRVEKAKVQGASGKYALWTWSCCTDYNFKNISEICLIKSAYCQGLCHHQEIVCLNLSADTATAQERVQVACDLSKEGVSLSLSHSHSVFSLFSLSIIRQ